MENKELDKWSKKEGFLIPEGYFNSFPERMMDRMETSKKKVFPVKRVIFKPEFYLALTFLIITVGILIIFKDKGKEVVISRKVESLKSDTFYSIERGHSIAHHVEKEDIKNYSIEKFKVSEIEEIARWEDTILHNKDFSSAYLSESVIEDALIESEIDEELIIEQLVRN